MITRMTMLPSTHMHIYVTFALLFFCAHVLWTSANVFANAPHTNVILEPFKTNKRKSNTSVILIGDSLLDNAKYVPVNKTVFDFLMKKNPKTYLFAADNSTISTAYIQSAYLDNMSNSDAWIVISIGGNDLLKYPSSYARIMKQYDNFIAYIHEQVPQSNVVLLNLFYPLNPDYKRYHPIIPKWNKHVQSIADKYHYYVVDVSSILVTRQDIVHDIEPSVTGGHKLANAIHKVIINS